MDTTHDPAQLARDFAGCGSLARRAQDDTEREAERQRWEAGLHRTYEGPITDERVREALGPDARVVGAPGQLPSWSVSRRALTRPERVRTGGDLLAQAESQCTRYLDPDSREAEDRRFGQLNRSPSSATDRRR